MPTHRIPTILAFIAVFTIAGAACTRAQVLIDDFSSGSLAGWIHHTFGASAPSTGMTFSAAGGAFAISSNGNLPVTAASIEGGTSIWGSSLAGTFYAHGTLRAKVTLDTPMTAATLGMRADAVPAANAVGFWISRGTSTMGIAEVVNGVTTFPSVVAMTFPSAGPYIMEAKAVGGALSLRVWLVAGAEPANPQSSITATGPVFGGLGVQANTPLTGSGPASAMIAATFDDIVFTPAKPALMMSQPLPGLPLSVLGSGLVAGREYFTVISLDLCPVAGSGPYLGICTSNPQFLIDQLLLPVGVLPFHFIASGPSQSLGSYPLPAGLTFDAIILEASTFLYGGHSAITRVTVN